MRRLLLLQLLMCWSMTNFGQETALPAMESAQLQKGRLFFSWGYNISGFSKSDIHLEGEHYSITVHDAEAMDRPSPVSSHIYLDLKRFTIPQYNYRLGYFFKDGWSISGAVDHMKYVFRNDQTTTVSGTVGQEASEQYAGNYDQEEMLISKDFLTFEHSDGLNYVNVQLDRHQKLWRNKHQELSASIGVGTGLIVARSDVRIFGEGINNKFHISGYGLSSTAGLRFHPYNSLFIQLSGTAGWINMPDILTTGTDADRASQHFWFTQASLVVGGSIALGK